MLHPAVVAAKQKLARGREKLRVQHETGSPGIQVCTLLTELLDSVVLDLFRAACTEIGEHLAERVALIPNGGYGRRDVAPFSDVDLMVLYARGTQAEVAPLVRKFTQHLYDATFDLGFSLRTPEEASTLALGDATIFTSLAESRFLAGNGELFERFVARFRRAAQRHTRGLIARIQEARRQERKQFGETVFLLSPNVKRSRGGLRDLQLIRWIGFARYGESEPENLVRLGVLSKLDHSRLLKARDFLLRLRNELHFFAGKPQDVLNKDEQLRIAEKYEYPNDQSLLAVERFMREYFEHTSEIRYAGAHFALGAKASNGILQALSPLFSHQVEGDFRVGPLHISATRRGLAKVSSDPAQVLRLMDLANLYGKRIDDRTWRAIRDAMIQRPAIVLTQDARRRFLSLISQTGQIGPLLRSLHELRVLEQIIPGLAHARCLMQFNEYHKYTVDEHSIRAVESTIEFQHLPNVLGDAYRQLKRKGVLHLALLLHDLGKGYPEDHSEVGRRLAEEVAAQLQLSPRDTETLKFLVHKHLLMSHLAQWRDINDEKVVLQLAVEVGSAERLQLLYILTCADLAAVGPGVLTSWKLDLLTRLYLRARAHLVEDETSSSSDHELIARREQLLKMCQSSEQRRWWEEQLAELPAVYVMDKPPALLFAELEQLRELPHTQAVAWARYLPEHQAVEYTVGTYEEISPGIFYRLTGALTSKGMQILSAEIQTLAHGLVLDRFFVHDMDFAQQPPPERLHEVTQALVAALKDEQGKPPAFRKIWQTQAPTPREHRLPTEVRIDTHTAERYTIVDVFAHDCMGLLYTITRTLFELGLSVHVAKIGTHLDQVVDVFYVTDFAGQKLYDEGRLNAIRQRLLEAIERLEAGEAAV